MTPSPTTTVFEASSASESARAGAPDADPARIAVVSEHSLVRQSVRAALRTRGEVVVDLQATPPPDIGLLLSDLDQTRAVSRAQRMVASVPVRWLVLAGSPPGPAWGALYDRGAALVVPASTRLDQVCGLIRRMRAGAALPATSRRELVAAWRTFEQRQQDLRSRLDSLSQRERQVLGQLHAGTAVSSIAAQSRVKEATVRSQVKAILRKLDVNSQLAAVTLFEAERSETVVAVPSSRLEA